MTHPRSLVSLLAGFAARGDALAIFEFAGADVRSWSYAQIACAAAGLAAGLPRAGVRPGDGVAIVAPNCAQWIIAYFGIVAAGAMAVPIDHGLGPEEMTRELRAGRCRVAFTTANIGKRLANGDVGHDLTIVCVGGPDTGAGQWRDLIDTEPHEMPAVAPEAVASLLFTSGTTGAPKGVPLTHRQVLANLDGLLAQGLVTADDRVALPLPLHHAYAFTVGMLGTLASGAALVLPAGMTGPQLADALKRGGATALVGVPRLYKALLDGIEARMAASRFHAVLSALLRLSTGLSRHLGVRIGRILFHRLHARLGPSLRLLASGGARLEPAIAWRLEGLGWQVFTGYGLTETAPILTLNTRRRTRIGTVGRAIAGVELRIAGADADTPGEILARGANVFAGYWRDDAATRDAFTADGWFRTGDLGVFDGDGFLTITGRAKELIVLGGGKNIQPEAIETILQESPYIAEIAVLERHGALVALVVPDADALRAGGAARAMDRLHEAIERASLNLPGYARLSGYAISRSPLPRTPLGKLRRHSLPALYEAARKGETARRTLTDTDRRRLESPLGAELWAWLQERHPGHTLTLDTSPQLDLGIDSLDWISVTMEIETRLGVRLSEAAVGRVLTLRDLLSEIEAAARGGAAAPSDAAAADRFRPLQPQGALMMFVTAVLFALAWATMRVIFGLRVRGLECLGADGPLVFTPNHASYLDPVALGVALGWRRLRRTYWGGWTRILFAGAFARFISRAAHVLPVDPDRGPALSMALAREALRRGDNLVWFPEGRRSETETMNQFRPGIGVLLETPGSRAVPVRISGTFAAWPLNRRWPRRRKVTVVFGEPLGADDLASAATGVDRPKLVAAALRDRVAALPAEL